MPNDYVYYSPTLTYNFTYTLLFSEICSKNWDYIRMVNQKWSHEKTPHLSNKKDEFPKRWTTKPRGLRLDPSNLCCPPLPDSTSNALDSMYKKNMWPNGAPFGQMCNLTMLGCRPKNPRLDPDEWLVSGECKPVWRRGAF